MELGNESLIYCAHQICLKNKHFIHDILVYKSFCPQKFIENLFWIQPITISQNDYYMGPLLT